MLTFERTGNCRVQKNSSHSVIPKRISTNCLFLKISNSKKLFSSICSCCMTFRNITLIQGCCIFRECDNEPPPDTSWLSYYWPLQVSFGLLDIYIRQTNTGMMRYFNWFTDLWFYIFDIHNCFPSNCWDQPSAGGLCYWSLSKVRLFKQLTSGMVSL